MREIENTWIPMPDGIRLAARIWLPDSADQDPVPAIFNYCPYFARFYSRASDDTRFPYYADHGYACIRVDIRGSGNSAGEPLDEYVKQEQDDGVEIIKWIASQDWCSGSVGMEGISWSGFNALQVAARRPPALKAIITHCFTDDRYRDDAHYKGGCIVHDMFNWGTSYLAHQGQAPDPDIVGTERWLEIWLQRLRAVDFNLANWLDHPHRDSFWKHGSVIEDYSQIACPVYAIGGWIDAYRNPIFRLLAGLRVPRKGLIGPWTHVYPHVGVPGPAIGYLEEALRWWDHWLKKVDTGILAEPMLRVWMQYRPATIGEKEVPGRWVAEHSWPSPRSRERTYFFGPSATLQPTRCENEEVALNPVQTVGQASGNWCPSGMGAYQDLDSELAGDQSIDDAESMTFDSAPLAEDFEILGSPTLTLEVASDRPVALVAVRLNEVSPTGQSLRVTYGVLNLSHRDSDEIPTPLEPGRHYAVKLSLDYIAHRFHAGHVIRISISTAYWPLVLPSPEPSTLFLFTGASCLTLPVRVADPEDLKLKPFPPTYCPPPTVSVISSVAGSHTVDWDQAGEKQIVRHDVGRRSALIPAIDTQLFGEQSMRGEISSNSTNSSIEYTFVRGWARDLYRPTIVASSKVTTTPLEFLLEGMLTAANGEERIFSRSWHRKISRQLV